MTLKKIFSVKGEIKIPFHGIDGESAYETACRHGFTGSEKEWLESLHYAPDNTVFFNGRSWNPVTDKVSSPGEPDSPLAHFAEKGRFEFIRVSGSGETLPYDISKYNIDGADGYLKNGDYVVWFGRWVRVSVQESVGSTKKNSDGQYSQKSGVNGLMSSTDKSYLTDLINVYWGREKLSVFITPDPKEGWQCNWLFDTGLYLGGIKKDCGGHPPVLKNNHTSWAILVLNGMATDADSLNHNHRLQIAFDVVNSRIYMRRGWMSENTWADKWEDVGKIADGSIVTSMLSDLCVTENKIAAGAVTTGKYANKSVTMAKLSEELQTLLNNHTGQIGSLADLNTAAKENVVAAVNEVKADAYTAAKIKGDIGTAWGVTSDDETINGQHIMDCTLKPGWIFTVSDNISMNLRVYLYGDEYKTFNLFKGDIVMALNSKCDYINAWAILYDSRTKNLTSLLDKTVKIRGSLGDIIVSDDPNYNEYAISVVHNIKPGDAFIVSSDQTNWWHSANPPKAGDMIISIGNDSSIESNWLIIRGAGATSALEARLAAIEQKLNGISFGIDSSGHLTYEKQAEVTA